MTPRKIRLMGAALAALLLTPALLDVAPAEAQRQERGAERGDRGDRGARGDRGGRREANRDGGQRQGRGEARPQRQDRQTADNRGNRGNRGDFARGPGRDPRNTDVSRAPREQSGRGDRRPVMRPVERTQNPPRRDVASRTPGRRDGQFTPGRDSRRDGTRGPGRRDGQYTPGRDGRGDGARTPGRNPGRDVNRRPDRDNRFDRRPDRDNRFDRRGDRDGRYGHRPDRDNRFDRRPGRDNRFDRRPGRDNRGDNGPNRRPGAHHDRRRWEYAQRRRDFYRDRARRQQQLRWIRHMNHGWNNSRYYGHWGPSSRWRYHRTYYNHGYNSRNFAYYDGLCRYNGNGNGAVVGALLGALVGGYAAGDDNVGAGILVGAGFGAVLGSSLDRFDQCDRAQYHYAMNYAFEYGQPYYWANPYSGVRGAIIIRETYYNAGVECRWGDAEIYMPDGTYNYDRVRMCRDGYGDWQVAYRQ